VPRVTWSKRLKDSLAGLLVVAGLLVAFFAVVGVVSLLRQSSCDRLNDARIVYLEPGHETPGPNSMFVRGVGPGPPPSQLEPYLEAEAEMQRAGCDVPGAILPSTSGG
jgi:hypothetical protein